jgi:hypothetical protein
MYQDQVMRVRKGRIGYLVSLEAQRYAVDRHVCTQMGAMERSDGKKRCVLAFSNDCGGISFGTVDDERAGLHGIALSVPQIDLIPFRLLFPGTTYAPLCQA